MIFKQVMMQSRRGAKLFLT